MPTKHKTITTSSPSTALMGISWSCSTKRKKYKKIGRRLLYNKSFRVIPISAKKIFCTVTLSLQIYLEMGKPGK